jgi:hypothetical protein
MYVHTGELLGQPLPKSAGPSLPDWAKLYLKSVRSNSLKNLKLYVPLFETITFHPVPLLSSSPLRKVNNLFAKDFVTFEAVSKLFLLELKRIRDARLSQNKSFAKLHEKHRKLFQDVLISFTKFEPKDLEPILIEALLPAPTPSGSDVFRGGPVWNLGKRFVQEKLPKGLSTRVTESTGYMQDALFAQLGRDLRDMAEKYQNVNANFKKKVEIERKARAKRP